MHFQYIKWRTKERLTLKLLLIVTATAAEPKIRNVWEGFQCRNKALIVFNQTSIRLTFLTPKVSSRLNTGGLVIFLYIRDFAYSRSKFCLFVITPVSFYTRFCNSRSKIRRMYLTFLTFFKLDLSGNFKNCWRSNS